MASIAPGRKIWAQPAVLPERVRAARVQARQRRQPAGPAAYFNELATVTLAGPQGPDPDKLLSALLEQMSTCLGRRFTRGRSDGELAPDTFWERRDGAGNWNGQVVLRIPALSELRALRQVVHGASVDVAGSLATLALTNPRLDSEPVCRLAQQPGNGSGGRQ